MGFGSDSEKMEVRCPECGAKNEILWFPSNKTKIELPGTRAGKTTRWVGRWEKIDGKCEECGYKFQTDDL